MTLDWTSVGVLATIIFGLLAVIIAFIQLLRTPPLPAKASSSFFSFKRNSEKCLDKAKKAIEKRELILFLKWKYNQAPMLEKCGHLYPVAVYPAPLSQRNDIESVLQHPLKKENTNSEKLFIDDSKYLDLVKSLKPGRGLSLNNDLNTNTYAMKSLAVGEKLKLECKLGRYFSSYCSCEALEWEIRSKIDKLKGFAEQDFQSFNRCLPLRNKLHHQVTNPILDGTGRSAAVGVSVLIAYNDQGTIKLLTKRRSSKGVPLRAGLLHVIPGFMFQPTTMEVNEEYNVTHNIYREYLEELFSLSDNIEEGRHANYFYHDNRLIYLKKLLADGRAKLYFSGITINLLNLRPEICALLLINTPEWYEKCQSDPELQWNLNHEFFDPRRPNDEGIVKPEELIGGIVFSRDDNQLLKDASIYPSRTVPAGAGAFWLGVDLLKDLLPVPESGT